MKSIGRSGLSRAARPVGNYSRSDVAGRNPVAEGSMAAMGFNVLFGLIHQQFKLKFMLIAGATNIFEGTSIYCREKPEDKADGAQKPECTHST